MLETGRPGPVTAFRSDMDCVLVTESDSPDHLPTACGFSSKRPALCMPAATTHTLSVALEVCRWLVDHKDQLKGTIKVLFQPAEEGVRGAGAMAASGVVDDVDTLIAPMSALSPSSARSAFVKAGSSPPPSLTFTSTAVRLMRAATLRRAAAR